VIELPAVVTDDSFPVMGNTTRRVDPYANDIAIDRDSVEYDDFETRGTVTLREDGYFDHTAPRNWGGTDSFTYTVWDLNADRTTPEW
jgi:hypothetical protein